MLYWDSGKEHGNYYSKLGLVNCFRSIELYFVGDTMVPNIE